MTSFQPAAIPPEAGAQVACAPSTDADVDAIREELEFHLELLRDDAIQRGIDPAMVEEEVLRRFGDPARHLKACIAARTRGRTMWLRISIAMNVLLAVGLVFTFLLARSAQERVMASELAAIRETQSFEGVKDALRRSLWSAPAGQIRVEGAVVRPGSFGTSFDAPLSLRDVITLAGGPAAEATIVSVRRAGDTAEATRRLSDLYGLAPEAGDSDPGPGDVVIVR